jgi:uridine phosphorylase
MSPAHASEIEKRGGPMESGEVVYHLNMKKGDVGRYVLLPGDPGRCELIASYFDDAHFVTRHREFTSYSGTLLGEKVSVTSTGIGSPSTAIAMEELIRLGADTFIRVGTSGGMQPYVQVGSLAIVTGAIRDEGTTRQYMPVEFPAVADIDVVCALREAASQSGVSYHLGISQSKDSFYGQHEPERMPVAEDLLNRWRAWKQGGAICSEMEVSTIFILGSIYRKRTGGVMLISGNQESNEPPHQGAGESLEGLIQTAVTALKILIAQDRVNRK